jgi:hypothetical protein
MARRTFFSFHYKPDVTRAQVVKKSQTVKDHEDTGFFDSSAFEEAQRKDPDSLKDFLRKEMEGSSVVCALVGAETALRRWVRFEIMQGIWDGRGIFGIRIHTIADFNRKTALAGPNPFDLLGVFVDDKKMYFTERATVSDKWSYTTDFGKQVLPKWAYGALPSNGTHPLSKFFLLNSWSPTAHNDIGDWIEAAAKNANR